MVLKPYILSLVLLLAACAESPGERKKEKSEKTEGSSTENSEESEEELASTPTEISGAFLVEVNCNWGAVVDDDLVRIGCWKEKQLNTATDQNEESSESAELALQPDFDKPSGSWELRDADGNVISTNIRTENVDGAEVIIDVPVASLLDATVSYSESELNGESKLQEELCGLWDKGISSCLRKTPKVSTCGLDFIGSKLATIQTKPICPGLPLDSFYMDGFARSISGFGNLGGKIANLGGEFSASVFCESQGIKSSGFLSIISTTKQRKLVNKFDPEGKEGFCFLPFEARVSIGDRNDTIRYTEYLFGGPPVDGDTDRPACFMAFARGPFSNSLLGGVSEAIMLVQNPDVLTSVENVEGLSSQRLAGTINEYGCEDTEVASLPGLDTDELPGVP